MRGLILTLAVACVHTPEPPARDPSTATKPAPSVCETLSSDAVARVAAATNACETAADCGCVAPIAASLGCGQVSDAQTVAAVATLQATFEQADCRWPRACGAALCEPVCVDGQCRAPVPAL